VPGGTTLEVTTQRQDPEAAARVIEALGRLPEVERAEQLGAADEGQPGGPGNGGPRTEALVVRLYVSGDAPLLVAPVAAALAGFGLTLTDVKLGIPTLEDVFIDLTGRALR
jgi:ABC-2 type transport system ATP-binding protein